MCLAHCCRIQTFVFVAALYLVSPPLAKSDTFRFKDGRVVSGKVLGEQVDSKDKRKVWSVEIESGVFLQVLESELAVNGFEPLNDKRQGYLENVAGKEQTLQYHLDLTGECSKHGLSDLARAHFLRILDFDPNYRPARVATGFTEDANGRWVRKEVLMGEQRGKVFVGGKWVFPEMVAIDKRQEEMRQKIGEATRDLHRWHNTIVSASTRNGRVEEALRGIQQINDPLATGKLAEFLLDTRKPAPSYLKMIYVQLLAQFQNLDSARALARASVIDPDVQVRNACLTAVSRYGREVAIPVYLSYLSSKSNQEINLAAEGLGQLRAETAVIPLIGVLVTKHLEQTGNGAGINASPTSGTFSMGSKGPTERTYENQSVLNTLSLLTGQGALGFDQSRWIAWYASVHAPPVSDPLRDP